VNASAGFLLLAVGLASGFALQDKTANQNSEPVTQPIPFSHKQHSSLGLTCVECHVGAKSADQAEFPETRKCMFCHATIKTDAPAIQKLAAAQKSGVPIKWVRVYHLPDFVFFSHASHFKAKVECVSCHGPVATRDVLAQEVPARMQTCVNCHKERHASTSCVLCHQLGQ
jgi:formate-dependent nitrite reductase cytochrome c552 subunit